MQLDITELVKKVRIAIDDITKDADEDFTKDADTEIKQAIEHAAIRVCKEAPANMLDPTVCGSEQWTKDGKASGQVMNADGSGSLVVPDNFIRLVELRLASWGRSVFTLMEPGSNEANMQASRWSRGNALKPKAMLGVNSSGQRVIDYWSAGRYTTKQADGTAKSVYNHQVERFAYVSRPTISESKIDICLTDDCLMHIVYMAAGIYLEGKKESTLADKMYQLAAFTD